MGITTHKILNVYHGLLRHGFLSLDLLLACSFLWQGWRESLVLRGGELP